MAVSVINFTTGPSTLPDTGELSYNGCTFSPLFETKVTGDPIKDNANRTVKLMKYTLTADGYVTMPTGATSINGVTETLRSLLTKQGGALVYRGRGIDLIINPQGAGGKRDAAWGPIPELLEFQPLGNGKSAKVRWSVVVHVTEVPNTATIRTDERGRITAGTVLQFNFDTSVDYGEDGYSTLTIKGTLEVPMSRVPSIESRRLLYTADSYRNYIERQIDGGLDLSRFRVTHRRFDVSRDKRTLDWEFVAEEKAYMDLPPDCTIARGTYSVKPTKMGMGLSNWMCTLRASYVVRADRPRRVAWFAFLALLRLRMAQSNLAVIPDNGQRRGNAFIIPAGPVNLVAFRPLDLWKDMFSATNRMTSESRNAWLIDFSFDEGLYLDSKTVSFSATWKLVCSFTHILLASGIWKKLPEVTGNRIGGGIGAGLIGGDGGGGGGVNLWAISMQDVQGSQSWLPNRLNPNLDVIVDFGGP